MSLYQREQISNCSNILCVVKKCIGKTKETRETSLNYLKNNQILGAHNINFLLIPFLVGFIPHNLFSLGSLVT